MATVLNTLYPPEIASFMPAFRYDQEVSIWFDISSYDEDMLKNIKFVHVSMVDQRNNQNIFAGVNNYNTVYPSLYPVKFSNCKYDEEKKLYKLTVPTSVLRTAPYFNPEQYYKIQLRFDLTGSTDDYPANGGFKDPTTYFSTSTVSKPGTTNSLNLASYMNLNQENFTEWSTGALVKAILIPEMTLTLGNNNTVYQTTNEKVVGNLSFSKSSKDTNTRTDNSECISWYQITLWNSSKVCVYDSGRVYPDTGVASNQINTYVDVSKLAAGSTNNYLQLEYGTNNNYTETKKYTFSVSQYADNTSAMVTTAVDDDLGEVKITVANLKYTNGCIAVHRTSHHSNFTEWELIEAKKVNGAKSLVVTDRTIESLAGYKYQIQYLAANGRAYAPIVTDIVCSDFYGILFSYQDKMVKLSFDGQITNISNATRRTKVDTLGGRYPKFTQNGKLNYRTYSISGKISTQDITDAAEALSIDEQINNTANTFLTRKDAIGSEYYNIRYKKIHDSHTEISDSYDWLYEREYRDALNSWLDDGKPKLFRSMPEGNLAVMLDAITLTPDQTLGRRLYSFTATMYEVGDGKNISSLSSLGIIDITDER